MLQPVKARARLAHVLFGIVPDAQREEFHQLARVVLVRMLLRLRALSRYLSIAGSLMIASVRSRTLPSAKRAEELVLRKPSAGEMLLPRRRGEVAVPEERHLLLQRCGRREHAIEPPAPSCRRIRAASAADLLAASATVRRCRDMPARNASIAPQLVDSAKPKARRQRAGRREISRASRRRDPSACAASAPLGRASPRSRRAAANGRPNAGSTGRDTARARCRAFSVPAGRYGAAGVHKRRLGRTAIGTTAHRSRTRARRVSSTLSTRPD